MNTKIILSWLSYNNDFKDGTFSPDGPTATFHREALTDYDRHYLFLSWAEGSKKEDLREGHLRSYLKQHKLNGRVQVVHLAINDPTSHNEIRGKVEQWLANNHVSGADVLVSTGTPTMQVVWYMLALNGGFGLKLFQTREKRHRKATDPLKEFISFEASATVSSIVVRQANSDQAERIPNYVRNTPSLKLIYEKAYKIAETDRVTTLILGETGTGKEDLAHTIHNLSARSGKPFRAINCSALADELLESRLFGYKKGAFTGADRDAEGFFEEANGGTLFLDEIGDISAKMQQALLRVLQQQEVTRIGEQKPRKVDVRVIAATHQSLVARCEVKLFRWDLYYRLAVAELELPSLRDRGREEIETLLDHFLREKQKQFGRKNRLILEPAVRETLLLYHFPGNVRELENLIERFYVFCEEIVTTHDLPARLAQPPLEFSWRMADIESQHLQRAYQHFKGNKQRIAEALGWSRTTLYERLKNTSLTSE